MNSLNLLSSLSSNSDIPTGLSVTEPIMDQARGTSRRYLKLFDRRVLVQVPEFFREAGLKFLMKDNMTSVLVPLDDGTRATLQTIEQFVQEKVAGKYKPLWLKDAMYVNVSKWCEYVQMNDDNTQTPLQPGTFLGKGFYSLIINPSNVYIGPHKGGETHSMSLRITRITYRPAQDIMDIIECLNKDFNEQRPVKAQGNDAVINKAAKKKKKSGRGKKSEQPKSLPNAVLS